MVRVDDSASTRGVELTKEITMSFKWSLSTTNGNKRSPPKTQRISERT